MQAVAEHAGTITGQVDQMAGTRLIWASERSTLAEALLVAAAGTRQAGIQTQVRVGFHIGTVNVIVVLFSGYVLCPCWKTLVLQC